MQKVRSMIVLYCLVLLTAGSMPTPPLLAQEGEAPTLERDILFAIESIIQSLEEQNAPVPLELRELLITGNAARSQGEIASFEEAAALYFGPEWQKDLLKDSVVLAAKERSLLVRSRIYLSSLIANADDIAIKSPLTPEEIKALSTDLLATFRAVQSEQDREAFYRALGDAYSEMFPEGDGDELSNFRVEVSTLLAELADAIAILVDGRKKTMLEANLADLQSRLLLVDETQKLTAWLARFDAFATKLLAEARPAEFSVLIADLGTLLTNLKTYLLTLKESGIETGSSLERVSTLRDDLSAVSTDRELNVLFGRLESLLMSVADSSTSPEEE
jgi:methyl-accepting chemotaxis protein